MQTSNHTQNENKNGRLTGSDVVSCCWSNTHETNVHVSHIGITCPCPMFYLCALPSVLCSFLRFATPLSMVAIAVSVLAWDMGHGPLVTCPSNVESNSRTSTRCFSPWSQYFSRFTGEMLVENVKDGFMELNCQLFFVEQFARETYTIHNVHDPKSRLQPWNTWTSRKHFAWVNVCCMACLLCMTSGAKFAFRSLHGPGPLR